MKHIKVLLYIICAVYFSACLSSGIIRINMPSKKAFNPNGQVLIVKKWRDPINIQDDLEHRFLQAGFAVRPEVLASIVKKEKKYRPSKKAMYTFQYEYYSRHTFFLRRLVFEKFTATMAEARSGKVIYSAKFQGSKSVSGFLDELVESLSVLLKQ